jgi:2-polyprenyl-3-methyl-5-hydroxy-6-metoxy-1,4-benzoquinol methylase
MPSSVPDFTSRIPPAELPEWLDEPRSYKELCAYMRSLEQVNTLTLSARPTLSWLEPLVKAAKGRTLRIVDVGCGSGDMLRRIERWATRRGVELKLTGIDLNAETIAIARDWTRNEAVKCSRIEWIAGNAFAYEEPVDIVLSALLTHHLEETEVVQLLAWMEETARMAWYVNDLVREETPYRLFSLVAKVLRWHKMVQHDGPVSFRRAFREDDWLRMLSAANIDASMVTLHRWTPGRLCAGRVK